MIVTRIPYRASDVYNKQPLKLNQQTPSILNQALVYAYLYACRNMHHTTEPPPPHTDTHTHTHTKAHNHEWKTHSVQNRNGGIQTEAGVLSVT